MNVKEFEISLFANGLYIEYELNIEDSLIRCVVTKENQRYKLTYKRNAHGIFVISKIETR